MEAKLRLRDLLLAAAALLPLAAEAQTPPTPTYTAVILNPQTGIPGASTDGKCWTQTDGLHCQYNGGPHGPFIPAGSVIPLTIGNTTISGGTTGRVLYDNGGLLGELTAAQLTADINAFSSSLSGAAPASGGGTANFLRADGTWATPAGTGVTATGSPASGNLTKWSGANSITNGDLSGDATTSGTLVVTVAKINGATLGTTTATSGNLLIGNGTQWATQAMTGDATITSGGAITLATVNSNVGSFGDGTHVGAFTVNGKGLITAASSVAISGAPPSGAASGDLSGSYPGPTVAKVNAVTYPSGPSANTVPVVTSATSGGTVTYEAVPNAALANSSMTIAGHSVSLGGTQAIACADLSNGATGCSTATGTSGATIPLLNGANTWSGVQSVNSGDLALKGATSGTITLNAAATAGTSTITLPGGTTDFSATGGTSQFVKQASAGAAFTVARPACADLSNAATSCSTDTTNATNITSGTLPIGQLPTTLVDSKCVTWDSTLAVTAQTIEYAIPWTSYTVTKMQSAVSGGGSYSVAAKINGTNITSLSAVSVSGTSNTNTSATGANTGSANDQITIVTSSPSGTINQSYVCLVFQHSAN